jgi:hypothetical protein
VALAWIEWRGIVWLADRRYFEVRPIVMSIYGGPDIQVVVPPGEGPPELIDLVPAQVRVYFTAAVVFIEWISIGS